MMIFPCTVLAFSLGRTNHHPFSIHSSPTRPTKSSSPSYSCSAVLPPRTSRTTAAIRSRITTTRRTTIVKRCDLCRLTIWSWLLGNHGKLATRCRWMNARRVILTTIPCSFMQNKTTILHSLQNMTFYNKFSII